MKDEKSYKDRGKTIFIWKTRAEELYIAANSVWQTNVDRHQLKDGSISEFHPLYRPAALLMGLALESLLKGLIIQTDNSVLDNGRINSDLTNHDLNSLFKRANVIVKDKKEKDFLKRISANVEWVSKYAVPSKVIKDKKQNTTRLLVRNDMEFDVFKELYSRVFLKLKTTA